MSFPGFPFVPTPGPGPAPTPTPHNLLSPTHGDTLTAAPGIGGLVYSTTGVWERLAPGAEGLQLTIQGGV
ncbi:MAG: hypothetical protein ACXABY_18980, partial [Candidatus Thorarchaeota archaeon]